MSLGHEPGSGANFSNLHTGDHGYLGIQRVSSIHPGQEMLAIQPDAALTRRRTNATERVWDGDAYRSEASKSLDKM